MPFFAVTTEPTFDIYYELKGSGPTRLLFLQGLGLNIQTWDNQMTHFSQQSCYTCLYVDNRGAGLTRDPTGLYSLRSWAENLIELLDYLNWTAKINVAGMSMGGMILQELVCIDSVRFETSVLISTHSGFSLPPLALFLGMPRCILSFNGINMTAAFLDILFPKSYLESRSRGPRESLKIRLYRSEVERDLNSKPTRLFSYLKQLAAVILHFVSAYRLQIAFKNIKTLVVTGTEDCVVRPRSSYKLAIHTGGQLKVFHGKGHMLHHESTREFNELLETHVSATQKDSL